MISQSESSTPEFLKACSADEADDEVFLIKTKPVQEATVLRSIVIPVFYWFLDRFFSPPADSK